MKTFFRASMSKPLKMAPGNPPTCSWHISGLSESRLGREAPPSCGTPRDGVPLAQRRPFSGPWPQRGSVRLHPVQGAQHRADRGWGGQPEHGESELGKLLCSPLALHIMSK